MTSELPGEYHLVMYMLNMKVLDLFPNIFTFLRPMPSLLEPPSKFTVTDGFGEIYQVGMFAAS